MNHVFDGPEGPINPRDYSSVFNAVSRSSLGNKALFDFLSSNFDKILNDLPNGESVVTTIFYLITKAVSDNDEIAKVNFEYLLIY